MGILNVSATWALVVLGAFLLVLLPKRNAVKAARFGIDPGLLGFKTVPGKLYFLIKGHEVVKARYEKVGSLIDLVRVEFADSLYYRRRTSPTTSKPLMLIAWFCLRDIFRSFKSRAPRH